MSQALEWSHHTVLITGAGGFIGSHLTERLVALGARTRAFVRYTSSNSWGWLDELPMKDDVEVILGDIRDRESLTEAIRGVDIVFHLAALIAIPYSYSTPLSYVRTNVEGTLNMLQVAREAGVTRLVHTSTSEVYGNAQYVPINEAHPLQAQSPYAASKIGADQLAESWFRSFGLPVTIVRPFNTFGPRQSARAIIPTIITQCLTETKVRVGNITPMRDFNYVSNTVEGFVRAAECPQAIGRTINLGSGRHVSIEELVGMVARLAGRDVRIERETERVRPEQSEVDRLLADTTTAKNLLGWEPSVSLEEGLQLTIEWVREHLDRYRLGVYVV